MIFKAKHKRTAEIPNNNRLMTVDPIPFNTTKNPIKITTKTANLSPSVV